LRRVLRVFDAISRGFTRELAEELYPWIIWFILIYGLYCLSIHIYLVSMMGDVEGYYRLHREHLGAIGDSIRRDLQSILEDSGRMIV